MLKRFAICLALTGAPQFAAAQSVQDQILSQLRDQGFSEMTLNRTWLGRIRVIAYRDDLRRELVFNPQTGEILRDYWRTIEDDGDDGPQLFNPGVGAGGGSNEDEDGGTGNDGGGDDDEGDNDEVDDETDDDDDEDNDDDDDDDDEGGDDDE